ncbi:MAG: V-type ATPase subunit, partial [Candidatus Micrarchaeota archaeon]|nr:V-type ATPase subunit [Candidatus Micrarchaeota archaeon]
MLKSDDGDYSYAYGVVSGKSYKLLTKKQMEDLARFKSVDELVVFLEGTDYESDIKHVRGKIIDIDELWKGIMNHFMRVYDEVVSFIPEKDSQVIEKLVMGNIEAENAEIILRMLHSGAESGRIKEMLAPCRWTEEYIDALTSSRSVKSFKDNLREKWLKEAIESSMETYEKQQTVIPIEISIEKALAKKWNAIESSISDDLKFYVGVKIDSINVIFLMRILTGTVIPSDI